MKANVGMVDRVIRLVLAVVLILLFGQDVLTGTLGIVTVVLALYITIIAVIGFSPIYALFKINTNKTKKKEA